MGASISKWSDLQESEALNRFVGDEPIGAEDPFWNGLFSVSVRRPSTRGDWQKLEEAVHPLWVSLAKNNEKTKNVSALVDVLLTRHSELGQALQSDK